MPMLPTMTSLAGQSLVIGNFTNESMALYHNDGSGLFTDKAMARWHRHGICQFADLQYVLL